jgi:hypothetical protein
MMVVFIGALCSALGAFWTTVRQAQERAQAADTRAQAEKDLREKSDVIADLHRQSADARAQAERELREKSDEIARLNRRVADLVTGGDGFCYLALAVRHGDTFQVAVVNEGDTPLYDVGGRIVDLAEFNAVSSGNKPPSLFNTGHQFIVGNLGAHHSMLIGSLNLGSGDAKDYNIIISARNGFVTQLLRCRRTPLGWRTATRVIRGTGSREVLFERVNDDFPRGPKGEIPWE